MRKRIDRYLRYIIVFLFISIYLKNRVSRPLANCERFLSLRFLIYIHNNHNSASGCIHTYSLYYITNGNLVSLAIFWRCTISKASGNLWGNSVRAFSHACMCDSRLHRDTAQSQRAHALFRREAHYICHDRSTLVMIPNEITSRIAHVNGMAIATVSFVFFSRNPKRNGFTAYRLCTICARRYYIYKYTYMYYIYIHTITTVYICCFYIFINRGVYLYKEHHEEIRLFRPLSNLHVPFN